MNSTKFMLVALFSALAHVSSCYHSIADYGAIPNNPSESAAVSNSHALQKVLVAANTSTTDRTVLIPRGQSYYYFWVRVDNLVNVTIQVDGILLVSNNVSSVQWPKDNDYASLWFRNARGLTLTGYGKIDGQGFDWWWHVIITDMDHRPHMIIMDSCSDVIITNLTFVDSPQYHLKLHHVMDVVIRNITIFVDVGKQKELLQKSQLWLPLRSTDKSDRDMLSYLKDSISGHTFEKLMEKLPPELEKILEELGVPTFPLNTDGIDPSGKNVLIEDVSITCFDDAVAVKPSSKGDPLSDCSQDMTIRNAKVTYGVGMTIGSVPPNNDVNCVRNITFENIEFLHPIKAIYIKSNPGDHGSGIIDSITYRHIHAKWPLWYPIWIGPQQQKQPGTTGTGCSFFYPIVDECPTQPRVNISNILLDNVLFEDGVTLPGVLLANATTPYTNFTFNNVSSSGFMAGNFLLNQNYVCKNVKGVGDKLTHPLPTCFTST